MGENNPGKDVPGQERATGEDAVEGKAREARSHGRVELPGGGVLESSEEETHELEVGFGDLVRPFLMMGLTGVGVLPHPDTGKPAIDLASARHAIAALEVLEARTVGQRSDEETRMLEHALFELKMQYVEAKGRSEKA